MRRSAGILMHISSLPSKHGIGTLGEEAYYFADFLKKSGQKFWQILPVGPTSYGDSPYQSFSSYAGNPYFIDLDLLFEDSFLLKEEYETINWGNDSRRVDYKKLYDKRFTVLRKAYHRAKTLMLPSFETFCEENKFWLQDYALFMAVKKYFGGVSWIEWKDEGIRLRKEESIAHYTNLLKDEIEFWKYTQFFFYRQWNSFKKYVNSLGIQLIGDMPIYVAADSADMWANPEVFWIDRQNRPVCVAGCPPDVFSKTGQLWGNPLYNWEYLKQTGYDWWIERIRHASTLFDITRIDHFRGFDSYYAVARGERTAENGIWKKGPGIDFFDALKKELGKIPIIAEDLGFLTKSVKHLLKKSGYPGMKVLQFAFDPQEGSNYLPHLYHKNCVVYTGTHDNDTIMGWLHHASKKEIAFAADYAALRKKEGYHWGMIRTAYQSVADLAIIPMQDFLGLGSEARMNTPSTVGENWRWRLDKNGISDQLIKKIKAFTKRYGRLKEDIELDKQQLAATLEQMARNEYCKEISALSIGELHVVIGKSIMGMISKKWEKSRKKNESSRRAYYFSAEFLMGRMIYQNLYSLGMLEDMKEVLEQYQISIESLEEIEDAALGNGGLGRLAACFLDSAATHDIPLDGYGIRYQYGLFKQQFKNGFQLETADNWQSFGDPWSIRREEDAVVVVFSDQTVKAVPYDMAVIGYQTNHINTLRLWQSEPMQEFDFLLFNEQKYQGAVLERTNAEALSDVLYPNDSGRAGKSLRLKQQYFFTSASLQDIIKKYKNTNGNDYSSFSAHYAIQLNDTHPVVAIPELIRLLQQDGVDFETAFCIARETFYYTNHTIMSEALEKWEVTLFSEILPDVYEIIQKIETRLENELVEKGYNQIVIEEAVCDRETEEISTILEIEDDKESMEQFEQVQETLKQSRPKTKLDLMKIIDAGLIHMARLAVYGSKHTNGVALLHTEILKTNVLKDWYELYPERFQNKTNGITQRRWLGLCNREFSSLITELIGDGWQKDLAKINRLEDHIDKETILRFNLIKEEKKRQLSRYIRTHDGVTIDPSYLFDIQVKRLHEYKRQLLNAFSILAIYFRLKEGTLKEFYPTAFIFGAKAAPGYLEAKAIIKYINEIARLINQDEEVENILKVVFVSNYNVSYAEKLIPAADISEQISAAGTEASGTGNMKFMLNGTVTLGTYDGANVEMIEQAGEENNYIFGARVEELRQIQKKYCPREIYEENPEIKKIVDTLIDGTFDDGGTGYFKGLYDSLLIGTSWHIPDNYFLLYDFNSYLKTKLKANRDYQDRIGFGKKCLINAANSGMFSSDRTIKQYQEELWHLV